jgi:Arc/MetJ-type ribon-helix-helix transcriptional regulator
MIKGLYIGSKVPNTIRNSIEKAVSTGIYLNISDFVRDAIKEKLDREGFLLSKSKGLDEISA